MKRETHQLREFPSFHTLTKTRFRIVIRSLSPDQYFRRAAFAFQRCHHLQYRPSQRQEQRQSNCSTADPRTNFLLSNLVHRDAPSCDRRLAELRGPSADRRHASFPSTSQDECQLFSGYKAAQPRSHTSQLIRKVLNRLRRSVAERAIRGCSARVGLFRGVCRECNQGKRKGFGRLFGGFAVCPTHHTRGEQQKDSQIQPGIHICPDQRKDRQNQADLVN